MAPCYSHKAVRDASNDPLPITFVPRNNPIFGVSQKCYSVADCPTNSQEVFLCPGLQPRRLRISLGLKLLGVFYQRKTPQTDEPVESAHLAIASRIAELAALADLSQSRNDIHAISQELDFLQELVAAHPHSEWLNDL